MSAEVPAELLAELREQAKANVATFPPLTDEQIAVVRQAFGETLIARPAPKRTRRRAS